MAADRAAPAGALAGDATCGAQAEPFAPAGDEWLALETWLMQRAAGMVWEGVALRP